MENEDWLLLGVGAAAIGGGIALWLRSRHAPQNTEPPPGNQTPPPTGGDDFAQLTAEMSALSAQLTSIAQQNQQAETQVAALTNQAKQLTAQQSALQGQLQQALTI